MTTPTELLFKIGQWFVNLDGKKMVIALLGIATCFFVYDRQQLKDANDRLDNKYNTYTNRTDSIISALREEIRRCDSLRFSDLQVLSDKYSKKIDELENQVYQDYKFLKQVKK